MSKAKIPPIPGTMQHMKQDERGYPIPYTSIQPDGTHDFRITATVKVDTCLEHKLCAICAKKLPKDYVYFLGGDKTFTNRLSLDAPVHRTCAEFALDTCPHIVFEKAQRRENNLDQFELIDDDVQDLDKPKAWYLIKADKYKRIEYQGHRLISFRIVSHEKFVYENGILTKSTEK